MEEELPTGTVIEYKEQFLLGLKGHVHTNNERVSNVTKNAAFSIRVFNLVSLDDVLLAKNFQRVNFIRLVFTNKEDFACAKYNR